MYDVLLDEARWTDVIVPTAVAGLDLAPADRALAGAQVELVGMPEREHRLEQAMRCASAAAPERDSARRPVPAATTWS